MYAILKIIQFFVRALNSEGTPAQVAAGLALGSVLGLTPLINLHNVVVLSAILVLNVSVPGRCLVGCSRSRSALPWTRCSMQ